MPRASAPPDAVSFPGVSGDLPGSLAGHGTGDCWDGTRAASYGWWSQWTCQSLNRAPAFPPASLSPSPLCLLSSVMRGCLRFARPLGFVQPRLPRQFLCLRICKALGESRKGAAFHVGQTRGASTCLQDELSPVKHRQCPSLWHRPAVGAKRDRAGRTRWHGAPTRVVPSPQMSLSTSVSGCSSPADQRRRLPGFQLASHRVLSTLCQSPASRGIGPVPPDGTQEPFSATQAQML